MGEITICTFGNCLALAEDGGMCDEHRELEALRALRDALRKYIVDKACTEGWIEVVDAYWKCEATNAK